MDCGVEVSFKESIFKPIQKILLAREEEKSKEDLKLKYRVSQIPQFNVQNVPV